MKLILATASPLVSDSLKCVLERTFSPLELVLVQKPHLFWEEVRGSTPADIALICFEPHTGFGFRFIETVAMQAHDLSLVVWNLSPDFSDAITVIQQGDSCYLGRQATVEHLAGALRRAGAGQRFVSPEVAETLVLEMGGVTGDESQPQLTAREREVLRLLSLGMKRSEIAAKLSLSPQTVSTYRTKIMQKTGARNTAHLVRGAIRHRLS